MRSTGDETTESRPFGDESAAGQTTGGDSSPTPVSVEPVDSEPTTSPADTDPPADPGGAPPAPSPDDLGTSGDTTAVDASVEDLSDQEAEEVVTEVFETAYGDEADGILEQIQDTLGLDFREILDILVGNSSEDDEGAYGEGAPEGEEETVDSSVGTTPFDDGTGDPLEADDEFGQDGSSPFASDNPDVVADSVDSVEADGWGTDAADSVDDGAVDPIGSGPGGEAATDATPDLG